MIGNRSLMISIKIESIACQDSRPTYGKIKRTSVRWLPAVAKGCLHIGFCTFRRRLNSAPRGGAAPLSEISFFISILQAMALAMCVDERPRCMFATLRAGAI
jgi:hypothetical protein